MTQFSDAELVQLSLAGDRTAFSQLVIRHLPRVRRVLFAAAKPEDVDDLLQEAFLQAYLGLESLREPARFRAWVCGIGLNLARMRYRSAWQGVVSWEQLQERETAVYDPHVSIEQQAEKQIALTQLRQAMVDLPSAERDALLLVYQNGLTHRETAVALNISVGAVKVRVHRGRHRLRERLTPPEHTKGRVGQPMPREDKMISVIVKDLLKKQSVIDAKAVLEPVLAVLPTEVHEKFLDGISFDLNEMMKAWELVLSLPEERQEAALDALAQFMPHHIVVLQEVGGERLLPIWIGPVEAASLALKLNNSELKRPITHDLMTTLFTLSQTHLLKATVSRLHEGVYHGTLVVQLGPGGEVVEVDCRVSDLINVAVRMQVSIEVTPDVMDETAVAGSDFYYQDDQGFFRLKLPRHAKPLWRSMLT